MKDICPYMRFLPPEEWKYIPEDECLENLPGPFEILQNRSPREKFIFFLSLVISTLLINLTLYSLRTIFLLSCVEDYPEQKPRSQEENELVPETEINLPEANGRQSQILRGRIAFPEDLPEESNKLRQWIELTIQRCTGLALICISFIPRLMFSGPRDRCLATHSVQSTYRHLRYETASFLPALRAIVPYVFYWIFVQRIAQILLMIPLFLIREGIRWVLKFCSRVFIKKVIDLPLIVSDFMLVPSSWILASGLLSAAFTFHTLRVLSSATGFSTNVISANIIDVKLFYRIRPFYVWKEHAYVALAYSISTLIPWSMTRDLGWDERKYSPLPDHLDFILERKDATRKIVTAHIVWIAIYFMLVNLSMWNMFRSQSQMMSRIESRIVRSSTRASSQVSTWKNLKELRDVNVLLRLLRATVQMGLVAFLVIGSIGAFMYWQITQLDDTGRLMDWAIRNYLSFETAVYGPSSYWYLFYWFSVWWEFYLY